MATTIWMEPGGAATKDFSFFTGTLVNEGTIQYSTQPVANSISSLKISTGTTNGDNQLFYIDNVLADAGRRISFYFRFNGTPNLANTYYLTDFIDINQNTQNATLYMLGLGSTNNLVLMSNNDPTSLAQVLGTSSITLAQNTDYQISLAYKITSGTVNTFTVFLNGSQVISSTNAHLNSVTSGELSMGAFQVGPGTFVNYYFSHFFIDNGTANSLGPVHITAKLPFANGNTNGFTTSGTASSYGSGNARYVNYRPLQTTTANVSKVGAGAAITEEYNIEGASIGDIDISQGTIVDNMGWLYAKSATTQTDEIIVNGGTSSIALTSTPTLFTKITSQNTYPAGTGADIGVITNTALTTTTLYDAGVLVAYLPGAAATTQRISYGNLIGVS